MKRESALVLLGAWLMGSICVSVVATENFYTVDRLLTTSSNAAFAGMAHTLGQPATRDLLRYLSSELNRLYFQIWNVAQLGLGIAALWLIRGRRGFAAKGIVAMLAIVVLMLVYLTPAIVTLGRELDFVPRDPPPPGMSRFWVLHAAFTSLEMIKLLLGTVVAVSVARSGSPDSR